jgi:hypothetical protein
VRGLPHLGQALFDPAERQGQRRPAPCRRRISSATKAPVIGGSERTMSATTRIRLFGSFSTAAAIRSAQVPASSRSVQPAATRTPTRRRFSIRASRSMIGMAHSSPSLSGVTVW